MIDQNEAERRKIMNRTPQEVESPRLKLQIQKVSTSINYFKREKIESDDEVDYIDRQTHRIDPVKLYEDQAKLE